MKMSSLGLAIIAFAAAAPTVALAQDGWYKFEYTNPGTGIHAYGSLEVTANTAVGGFISVDTGPLTGFWPLYANPNGNTRSTSPLGGFFYDNFIDPSAEPASPYLTGDGLLFDNGGASEINVWGNGPGNYSIFGAPPNYVLADNGGSFTMTSAPAPGSAALLGLAGLAASRRRR